MRFVAFCLLFIGALAGSLSATTTAGASTTYVYAGNPFNSWPAPPNDLPCPSACGLSGSLTLTSPLAPNQPIASVSPLSFSFTDGQFTWDNSNTDLINNFQIYVGTDAVGNINDWGLSFLAPYPGGSTIMQTFNTGAFTPQGSGVIDIVVRYLSANLVGISTQPGSWTVVPEPSTALLLGLGTAALAAGRRFA